MNNDNASLHYRIPPSLHEELRDLDRRIGGYLGGSVSAAQLKAYRVPFGIYEQRVKGLYMARIRCPAGIISPAQLGTVARIAGEHGSGSLHITTRQELQVHDVPIDRLSPLLFALADAGLSTRGGGGNTVRNITASWDAGIAKDEPFDVTPHAVELTSRMVELHDSWLLPRKFKIAFSNGAADSAFATVNDVGFIAAVNNGRPGFRVFVAGGMGRSPQPGMLLHDFVAEDEVFSVAEALKRLFSRYGNRRNKHAARLRFLRNRLGREQFAELYKKERLALAAEKPAPFILPVDALRGAAGIRVQPESPADPEAFTLWRKRYVSRQRQEGLYGVRIPLLLGNIPASTASVLAGALLPFGNDSLRFTQDQNIVARNIPAAHLGTIFNLSRRIAPLCTEAPLYGNAVACAGASTCQLGICRSRGALTAVMEHLRTTGIDLDALGHFRMHISGCNNSCGQHAIADLGFAGKAAGADDKRRYPAYSVFTGAKLDGLFVSMLAEKAGEVPARDLPEFVRRLLDHYISRIRNYNSFHEYLALDGRTFIATLCAELHPVPSYEAAPEYYRDFDDMNDFNLEGRGTGECAAGLFDLVDIDMARLRELRQLIAEISDIAERPKILHELAFVAARALLVTRGVEASDATVFDEFGKHFIEAGLVSSRFGPLVNALGSDPQNASITERDIFDLAQAIETLYATMDDTLQFHPENAPATSPVIKVDAEKDFRNVACPMNFVKTKMALSQLHAGQLLKIQLDDGAPIDNVPRSVEAEGHEIVTKEKTGDHWTVVIRKGR